MSSVSASNTSTGLEQLAGSASDPLIHLLRKLEERVAGAETEGIRNANNVCWGFFWHAYSPLSWE
jgi:hypothetical protein